MCGSASLPDPGVEQAGQRNRNASAYYRKSAMKLLDVVATLEDVPAAHLAKGQVGTIVDAWRWQQACESRVAGK